MLSCPTGPSSSCNIHLNEAPVSALAKADSQEILISSTGLPKLLPKLPPNPSAEMSALITSPAAKNNIKANSIPPKATPSSPTPNAPWNSPSAKTPNNKNNISTKLKPKKWFPKSTTASAKSLANVSVTTATASSPRTHAPLTAAPTASLSSSVSHLKSPTYAPARKPAASNFIANA
jgi:hypothetical protein